MPPRAPKVKAPSEGDRFECRVARLTFVEGALVRRKVDLEVQFHEPFQVTDIDVLALRFSETLEAALELGECKTTEAKNAPSTADRLLWNVGLQRLVGAENGFVATKKPASDRVRRFADRLGNQVFDLRDIERREAIFQIDGDHLYGSHDPDLLSIQRRVASIARDDDELRRLYVLVRSEFWFATPASGLKRALEVCRRAGQRWGARLPDDERLTIEWLLMEGVVAVAVSLTRIAGFALRSPTDVFERWLVERLAEGVASYRTLEEISKVVDRFVLEVLKDAGADPAKQVDSMGAFSPTPPAYTEPLLEVVHRLAATPRITRDLARFIDWRAAKSLGAKSAGEEQLFDRADDLARATRIVSRFLHGQFGVPQELLSRLNGADESRVAETSGSSDAAEEPENDNAREQMSLEDGGQQRFIGQKRSDS